MADHWQQQAEVAFQAKIKKRFFAHKKKVHKNFLKRLNAPDSGWDNENLRKSKKYWNWRKTCLERDHYRCVRCGSTNSLEVHHLRPWSKYPAERFKTSNGVTLCWGCHTKDFHPWRKDLFKTPQKPVITRLRKGSTERGLL